MLLLNLEELYKGKLIPWPLKHNHPSIISIQDRHYIDSSSENLLGKLGKELSKADINIQDNDQIFLLTAPAVFGYSFNPAVFFFIIDKNSSLKSCLVEVHNTFGESHCYPLKANPPNGNSMSATSNKEFHVSPFLDRKGHYEFEFTLSKTIADISITLIQENREVLNSRFEGNLVPLRTANLLTNLPRILSSVILTEFRILKQAYRLYFKYKMKYFSKPNPLQGTTESPSKGFISKLKIRL